MGLHGEGQQHLPGVLLAFLGPQAHRHRWHEDAQDNGQGDKEGAHIGAQDREEGRHKESDARQEHDHKDIADGRFVVGSKLTSKDSVEIPHALHPRQSEGSVLQSGPETFPQGWVETRVIQ